MELIAANLLCYQDTCKVYIVRSGSSAVLVDFGDGEVLDRLAGQGVAQVTDILLTHHHRDQAQGLARRLAEGRDCLAGVRIWAPHAEQELFHSVDQHWQARPLLNNYDVRQDRFSLLEPVALAGTLKDYAVYDFGGRAWTVVPTPGHTPGSVTLLVDVDGCRAAFTGDAIAGPGKVWSLAALQWSYQLMDGAAVLIPSLVDLRQRRPDCLLPSHGPVMRDPAGAIDQLLVNLRCLLDARGENMRLSSWLQAPYEVVTPHLLRNLTSVANSYVLLSDSGKALLLDYGYDFLTSPVSGPDRAWRRPWLYSLPMLKRDYGVTKIDVVVATHYHEDHVAGFNLLRDIEGTQVWAADTFAHILEHPDDYDLPCLWYDPIPVDRVMAAAQPVQWEEYTLTAYPLAGHTRYAAAIAFTVDGIRVLATGDQYKGNGGTSWNYVYQNRFAPEDFQNSADLYARLAPDLVLPGHWEPLWVTEDYLRQLRAGGDQLVELHRDLLPLAIVDLGCEGFAARMMPYHYQGRAGSSVEYQVEVLNPLDQPAEVQIGLVLPPGWQTGAVNQRVQLEPFASGMVRFTVTLPEGITGRRFRIAVDVTAGDLRLGQQAEALIDIIA